MIKGDLQGCLFTCTIDSVFLSVVSNFQREVLLIREHDFFPHLNIDHRSSYFEFCVLFKYFHPVVKT